MRKKIGSCLFTELFSDGRVGVAGATGYARACIVVLLWQWTEEGESEHLGVAVHLW